MAKPETLRLSRKLCRHAKGPISEGAGCDQREQTGGVSAGTPSVTACAVPAPPRGRLWHCRKVCRYAGNGLALSGANAPAPPKGELLAKPETLRLSRNVCRHAKGPISEGAVAVGDWGSSGSTPSVTACAVPAPPRGRLWQCRKVCLHRPKPSPWGRWIAAKRQDGRGNAAVYRCAPSVKRQCWKIRRFSSIANLKINFPLNMARAQRRPF